MYAHNSYFLLCIYNFSLFFFKNFSMNKFITCIGLGAHHSGVEVYGLGKFSIFYFKILHLMRWFHFRIWLCIPRWIWYRNFQHDSKRCFWVWKSMYIQVLYYYLLCCTWVLILISYKFKFKFSVISNLMGFCFLKNTKCNK